MRYYDPDIIRVVSASDKPIRHAEIAERIAPGNTAAFYGIGSSLTKLYRKGVLRREKIDGRYHYWMVRTR